MERSVVEMARRTLENIMPIATRVPLADVTSSTQSFFRDNINKQARTILLQIDGLDDLHCRRIIEQQLLEVKGVVSFTFDMKTSRVSIRVRDWVKIEVSGGHLFLPNFLTGISTPLLRPSVNVFLIPK